LYVRACVFYTKKNDFAETSKQDIDLKIILLESKYVKNSSIISNATKTFDILTTSLNVPYNYFDNSQWMK